MIVSASLRALVRRRARTVLALCGIAVSAALLLDMTMLATGLTSSFGELVGASGYGLRISPRGTLPFDGEATIADASGVAARVGAVPGVRGVAPVLGAQFFTVRGDSAVTPFFTVGVAEGAGFQYALLSGRHPGPGEVVVSRALARDAAVSPGRTLRVAPAGSVSLGMVRGAVTARVSGIGDFIFDHADQHTAAMPLADVQRATGRPDQVSLFGVAAAPGDDGEALAGRIAAAVPTVEVHSTARLMGEMHRRLLYFRQLATILGSIAMVVTALLVGTIVTIGVRERFGEIATLRAMGVPRRRILLGVVAEGLFLAGAGCAAGIPLGLWLARRLDRILLSFPGIPARMTFFAWDAGRVLSAVAVVVALGALAGLLPGLHAVRTPLAAALREEAE